MKTSMVVAICFLAASALAGTDVSGRWTGTAVVTVDGNDPQNYSLHLQLTQKGQLVSGTISREDGERIPIEQGACQGTKLSFRVVPPETMEPITFELEINGDRLEGVLKGTAEDNSLNGKVTLTRVK
jgi:hypothetical protein